MLTKEPPAKLRLVRVGHGFSLFDIEAAVGIPAHRLSLAERGRLVLRRDELAALCVLFDWPKARAAELLEPAMPRRGAGLQALVEATP